MALNDKPRYQPNGCKRLMIHYMQIERKSFVV